jgi:hypothetical protein
MVKYYRKMNTVSHSKSLPSFSYLDYYYFCRSQILIIKDLRQSDTGNYTCELFNSFGAINATYILVVTGKKLNLFFVQILNFNFFRKITFFW